MAASLMYRSPDSKLGLSACDSVSCCYHVPVFSRDLRWVFEAHPRHLLALFHISGSLMVLDPLSKRLILIWNLASNCGVSSKQPYILGNALPSEVATHPSDIALRRNYLSFTANSKPSICLIVVPESQESPLLCILYHLWRSVSDAISEFVLSSHLVTMTG